MITDILLQSVLVIFDFIFSQLPDITISVPYSFIEPALDIIKSILYFFPMKAVVPMILAVWCLGCFRFWIRFIRTIWDILPLL